MRRRIINLITYMLTLGLGIFFIWLSLKDLSPSDWNIIHDALKRAHYGLLFPILVMGFISHWCRAVRWRYLMQPLGLLPSLKNTFFAVMIGYLANLAFPRLGEVLKCTILARYEKIPADKLVGTIIAERAFDMLCLLLIFFITFIVQIDFAKERIQDLIDKMNAEGGNSDHTLKYVILGSLALISLLLYFFRKRIGQIGFILKLKAIFSNILSGITSFRYMKNKLGFVVQTLLIWGMYLGMIVIGFQSIDETSMLGIKAGFSVLSFGSIGMIVTPGGIGTYPIIVQGIVTQYIHNTAISAAIGWIIWLVPTCIILLYGLISFALLPLLNKQKHVQ